MLQAGAKGMEEEEEEVIVPGLVYRCNCRS
jgi:hypothetical protein